MAPRVRFARRVVVGGLALVAALIRPRGLVGSLALCKLGTVDCFGSSRERSGDGDGSLKSGRHEVALFFFTVCL